LITDSAYLKGTAILIANRRPIMAGIFVEEHSAAGRKQRRMKSFVCQWEVWPQIAVLSGAD
jgi:hypothetical protein